MQAGHQSDITIGITTGASEVLVGSYVSNSIDIQDLAAMGTGPGISALSSLAHEIAEHSAKQIFGLRNPTSLMDTRDRDIAHQFGNAAQNAVSGFTRGKPIIHESSSGKGGIIATDQVRGDLIIRVFIYFRNGNVLLVHRR